MADRPASTSSSAHGAGPDALPDVLPEALAELVGATESLADRWVALDPDTLTVTEAGALAEVVDRQVNRLQAAGAKLAASFARRDGHRRTGHRSLSHWMADRLRRSPTQARKEARTAEQLADLSSTADALAGGDISLEHAAAIAEQASKTDDPQAAQRSLLAEARTSDPGRVRKAGRRMRRDQDRRAAEARKVRRAREQRTLSFRADEAAKTMWIEGRLPMIDGVKVRAAVDSLTAPTGRDDTRTYGQRMADGLVELVDRAEHGSGLPPQRGLPVEVMAVVNVEAIEGRAGVPAGTICGAPGGGIDLSDVELRQLLEQADLSWLIVDPAGVPLRHGRSRRYACANQRRVIRARDGGCAWPRCDAPAVWCLIHHQPPYDQPGGATDVDTQAAFCDVHHEMCHKSGWTVELDAHGTVTVTSPDGTTVLTETAAQRRARHGTLELSTTSHQHDANGDHRDGASAHSEQTRPDIGSEAHATYHVGFDPAPRSRCRSGPTDPGSRGRTPAPRLRSRDPPRGWSCPSGARRPRSGNRYWTGS